MVGISPTDPFVVLINSSHDVISDHLLPFSVKKKKVKIGSRVDRCVIYIRNKYQNEMKVF